MVEQIISIAQAQMPVDEVLQIRKHRMMPEDADITEKEAGRTEKGEAGPAGEGTGKYPRICVVTGIHGDELEGQFVCYELSRRIRENAQHLKGIVDIYPAMNPFGIDSITRGIPAFDLDMNRVFPGSPDGDMNEYLASCIMEDMKGADLALDIHASNIYLTEVPQIRINERHKEKLVPIAEHANVDLIWVHAASTVLESTFAYSLNSLNTPTLVVEMGVGMRITQAYGHQLVDGIFSLMADRGIWDGPVPEVKKPVIAYDEDGQDVFYLNAPASGVYVRYISHGTMVREGDHIGDIVNPLTGDLVADVRAPGDGWLFTAREYPIVEDGSLMGRILKKEAL